MFHHILVPLDGSEYSERALQPAIAVADAMGARITVMAVSLRFPESKIHSPRLDAQADERTRAYLDGLITKLPEHSTSIDVATAMGVPADEVLRYAREHGVDLIVMTTHGATADASAALGSTAWKVLQHAHCPVLLERAAVSMGG